MDLKDAISEKIHQINQRKEQIYGRKTKAEKCIKGFKVNYKIFANYITISLLDILTFKADNNIMSKYLLIY